LKRAFTETCRRSLPSAIGELIFEMNERSYSSADGIESDRLRFSVGPSRCRSGSTRRALRPACG